MIIRKIILENFLYLYNTTGKKTIEIDRTNSNNTIVLILGANGSGKTTIMTEISPFPVENIAGRNITFNNRFLENTIGRKYLLIENKDILYHINITYDKNKTNCFITKENTLNNSKVELNTNGNVSSYLTILDSELNLKKNYATIGYLSNGIKNLVTMTSMERTNHIGSWIPFITDFIKNYKIIQQKIGILNRQIDLFNKDIGKIDSGDLENDIKNLESELIKLNKEKENINNENIKIDIYLNELPNNSYDEVKTTVDYYKKQSIELNKEKEELISFMKSIKNSKEINEKTIVNKINNKELLNKELSIELDKISNEIKLIKDNIIIDNIDLSPEDIQKFNNITILIKNLKDEIIILEEKEKNMKKEYSYLDNYEINNIELSEIKNFLNNISLLYEAITETILFDDLTKKEIIKLESKIIEYKTKLSEIESKINKKLDRLNQLKSKVITENTIDLNKRCSDDCKLYKEIKKILYPDDEIAKLEEELSYEQKDKTILIDKINELSIKRANIVDFLLKIQTLNRKLIELSNITHKLPKEIKEKLNEDSIVIIKNVYYTLELVNKLFSFNTLKDALNNKKITLKDINNQHLINSNNIEKYKKNKIFTDKLNNLSEKRIKIINEIDIIKEDLVNLTNLKNNIATIKDSVDNYNIKVNKHNDNNKLNSLIKAWYCVSTMKKYKIKIKNDLNKLNDNISNLVKNIEIKKNNLVSQKILIDKRNKLIKERKNNKILYDVWSPKYGIPSKFINNFLYNIKEKTNEYLNNLWNDELLIKSMEIVDNNFPIIVEKNKKDKSYSDAYECSNGEKATLTTAISLAMLDEIMNDIEGYNILRFDEIDNVLDSEKQNIFIDILLTRIKEINCENCYMITHNKNFDNIPADVILLQGANSNNIDLSNKNILFTI